MKQPNIRFIVSDDPACAAIRRRLTDELHRLQAEYGDRPYVKDRA